MSTATPDSRTATPDNLELSRLVNRSHRLAARLLGSGYQVTEEQAQVLAEASAAAGVGSALGPLLPVLRAAARMEETLQRFDALRARRRTREDHPAEV